MVFNYKSKECDERILWESIAEIKLFMLMMENNFCKRTCIEKCQKWIDPPGYFTPWSIPGYMIMIKNSEESWISPSFNFAQKNHHFQAFFWPWNYCKEHSNLFSSLNFSSDQEKKIMGIDMCAFVQTPRFTKKSIEPWQNFFQDFELWFWIKEVLVCIIM